MWFMDRHVWQFCQSTAHSMIAQVCIYMSFMFLIFAFSPFFVFFLNTDSYSDINHSYSFLHFIFHILHLILHRDVDKWIIIEFYVL